GLGQAVDGQALDARVGESNRVVVGIEAQPGAGAQRAGDRRADEAATARGQLHIDGDAVAVGLQAQARLADLELDRVEQAPMDRKALAERRLQARLRNL